MCSEQFADKRLALGCAHLNRLVELVAQYSFCEYEDCSKAGVQMNPAKLRDHVTEHAEAEKDKVGNEEHGMRKHDLNIFYSCRRSNRLFVTGRDAKRHVQRLQLF